MNTEFGTLTSAANPFAAFLSPEVVVAAHKRLSTRVVSVIHRPLDKPRPVRPDQQQFDDMDVELEFPDEMNEPYVLEFN